ncbi:MAG: hypothetical protein ACREOH_15930 [Candidatus Entotheonellia bacterium]
MPTALEDVAAIIGIVVERGDAGVNRRARFPVSAHEFEASKYLKFF